VDRIGSSRVFYIDPIIQKIDFDRFKIQSFFLYWNTWSWYQYHRYITRGTDTVSIPVLPVPESIRHKRCVTSPDTSPSPWIDTSQEVRIQYRYQYYHSLNWYYVTRGALRHHSRYVTRRALQFPISVPVPESIDTSQEVRYQSALIPVPVPPIRHKRCGYSIDTTTTCWISQISLYVSRWRLRHNVECIC
jgi:hypothetical protein